MVTVSSTHQHHRSTAGGRGVRSGRRQRIRRSDHSGAHRQRVATGRWSQETWTFLTDFLVFSGGEPSEIWDFVVFEGFSRFSPPARWGLLDFMSVACSSPPLLSSSCSTATLDAQCSLSDLNHDHPRPVFPAGTSTTTIPAQCSLPDLNHDHPRPVFPAGPQPRASPPSVPCLLVSCSQFAQQAFGLEDKRARDETTLAA